MDHAIPSFFCLPTLPVGNSHLGEQGGLSLGTQGTELAFSSPVFLTGNYRQRRPLGGPWGTGHRPGGRMGELWHQTRGPEGQQKSHGQLTRVLGPGWHRALGLGDVKAQTCLSGDIPAPSTEASRSQRARVGGWGRVAASLRLLPAPLWPIPCEGPASLANGTRCCFGENTFWSLLCEPSQLTPTVEKTCQDKWEISS